jgi:hypothetical protein
MLILQAALTLSIATPPVAFVLEDQHEKTHRAEGIFDRPVVIVAGDQRKTDEDIRDWAKALRPLTGSKIRIVGLADLDGVPFFVPNGSVRSGIRETNPDTIVLCDWEGEVFEKFGFKTELPNVHVYDATGQLVGKVTGTATETRVSMVAKLLAGL